MIRPETRELSATRLREIRAESVLKLDEELTTRLGLDVFSLPGGRSLLVRPGGSGLLYESRAEFIAMLDEVARLVRHGPVQKVRTDHAWHRHSRNQHRISQGVEAGEEMEKRYGVRAGRSDRSTRARGDYAERQRQDEFSCGGDRRWSRTQHGERAEQE